MRYLTHLLIASLACACGQTNQSTPSVPNSSRIPFSVWQAPTVSKVNYLNISGTLATQGTIVWTFKDGTMCQSTITTTGDNSIGTFAISATTTVAPAVNSPDCTGLANSYAYAIQGSSMNLCQGTTCEAYK